jgi:polysaccharide export outer membrane protein
LRRFKNASSIIIFIKVYNLLIMIKKIVLFIFMICFFTSCVPKERLIYFQGIEKLQQNSEKVDYQPILQPDDLLLIIVSAPSPEAAIPYNLISYSGMDTSDSAQSGVRYQTYLIDKEGNIDFPVLGLLKLAGLTKIAAVEKIKVELKKYINSPIVNLRIMNFKVSVMGEVAKPGMYELKTERVTLPEALTNAGDMTIYGDRKEVLIIRDVAGVKTHNFIDITSADFINSPFYYLAQNDLVYVRPNGTKINSSAIGPNINVALSAISLIITIIALTTR